MNECTYTLHIYNGDRGTLMGYCVPIYRSDNLELTIKPVH